MSGNNIDHIGGFWQAAEGMQSVDLNGAGPGTVSQLLTTVPGQAYRIRYALSENFFGFADKTMNVPLGRRRRGCAHCDAQPRSGRSRACSGRTGR